MIRPATLLRLFLFLALALSLGGCKTVGGWFGSSEAETETLPVEGLYAQAREYRDKGSYDAATKYYQRLIARFPYGPYNEQAQIDLAYVLYKTEKPEEATAAIDRFIRTFPQHQQIAYAYYLKALINFDRGNGYLTRLARRDPSQRDLSGPIQSYNDFNEVLRRFPTSIYAPDARQRMVYLRNELARADLVVGLYYYRRGAWVSAAIRPQYQLETYPTSHYDAERRAQMAGS